MTWLRLHPTEQPAVAPSLLAADFSRLGSEIAAVENAGADLLHLDVMDGDFVDNITFGPVVVRAIRKLTTLYLDTHLMVREPQRYVQAFRDAGADHLTVHAEASDDLQGSLDAVRATGASVGMSVNPDTALGPFERYLDQIDLLLIMSVQPGWGGQSFREEVLAKVERAFELRQQKNARFAIEIDGGIDPETAVRARQAGADVLVAGSAIFRHPPYRTPIEALRTAGDRLRA